MKLRDLSGAEPGSLISKNTHLVIFYKIQIEAAKTLVKPSGILYSKLAN